MSERSAAEFIHQHGDGLACSNRGALAMADYCAAKPTRMCCRCGSEIPAT
jgi:hypothetical protein